MTCIFCGQPEHPVVSCITVLRTALRRKELVASELLDACKAGRNWMWGNAYKNISRSPTLAQMELAIERAEEDK